MCEKRRGVVMIVRRGDPEITGAIMGGIERGSPIGPAGHFPTHGGEAFEESAVAPAGLVRGVALHRGKSDDDIDAAIAKARYDYGDVWAPSGLIRRLWALYGLIVYLLAAAYRAQEKVLKEGDTR